MYEDEDQDQAHDGGGGGPVGQSPGERGQQQEEGQQVGERGIGAGPGVAGF